MARSTEEIFSSFEVKRKDVREKTSLLYKATGPIVLFVKRVYKNLRNYFRHISDESTIYPTNLGLHNKNMRSDMSYYLKFTFNKLAFRIRYGLVDMMIYAILVLLIFLMILPVFLITYLLMLFIVF